MSELGNSAGLVVIRFESVQGLPRIKKASHSIAVSTENRTG